MRQQRCQRCGSRTDGTREGDTEYCTACGAVLGPAFTPDDDDRETWQEADARYYREPDAQG